jgi:hypothetical protein
MKCKKIRVQIRVRIRVRVSIRVGMRRVRAREGIKVKDKFTVMVILNVKVRILSFQV